MRVYSLTELFNLTRAELFSLHNRIVCALAQLTEGSAERHAALINLRNIRRMLARPNCCPR